MAEGARLGSVYAGDRIEGSNPFLSAKIRQKLHTTFLRNWSDSGNLPQSYHNRKEKVWLLYAKKVVFGRYKSALKKGQSQDALLRNLMLQIGGLRQKQQLDKVCMSITQGLLLVATGNL